MRRGQQRQNRKKEDESKVSLPEGRKRKSKKVPEGAKRRRVTKPVQEPEYFPEKRNLEDLWREVFPVGTEWDQMDSVYKYNWNFSSLEEAFEKEGVLYGKKAYLFGGTEPQLVPFKGENTIVYIPVVVAIDSALPPSDKIGISSVQREGEEIVPMQKMKMAWVPYIPEEDRGADVSRLKSKIYILRCTQRRVALNQLKIDRIKTYEYCLPYFQKLTEEDELEQSTVVDIIFPTDKEPVVCEFDWELDDLKEFTDKKVEDEELSEDQKDDFKEYVKEKVREAKKENREVREARKRALAEMSEETKRAYQAMRFYKFYPAQTKDTPDVSSVKASFINRYYGHAHHVF